MHLSLQRLIALFNVVNIIMARLRAIMKLTSPMSCQPQIYLVLASGTKAENMQRLYVQMSVRASLMKSKLFMKGKT